MAGELRRKELLLERAHIQVLLVVAGVVLAAWNIGAGVVIGLLFLLPIVIAIDLGVSRDRTGWMWGLFLGWLGVLILACMRPRPAEQRPPKELKPF
jgi:hypothetical protein